MGPAVSCEYVNGMMPDLLISPTVGLIPTTEFCIAGLKIEASVSVPTDNTVKFAAAAAAEPELDPPKKILPDHKDSKFDLPLHYIQPTFLKTYHLLILSYSFSLK